MQTDDKHAVFMERLTSAQPELFALAAAIFPFSKSDADDLVQDANLALIRHRSAYDPNRRFKPWMSAIVRNIAMDFQRKRYRSRVLFDSEILDNITGNLAEGTPEGDSPEPALRRLSLCRRQLSAEYRELLRLRYDEKLSLAQIAARKNRKEKAVHDALTKTRRRLALCMKNLCKLDDAQFEFLHPELFDEAIRSLCDDGPAMDGERRREFARLLKDKNVASNVFDQIYVHTLLDRPFERIKPRQKRKLKTAVFATFALTAAAVPLLISFANNRPQNVSTENTEMNTKAIAAATLLTLAGTELNAAGNRTWTGASSSLWSDAGNWREGAWSDGCNAIFPADATRRTIDFDVDGAQIDTITFAGSGYTINVGDKSIYIFKGAIQNDATGNVLEIDGGSIGGWNANSSSIFSSAQDGVKIHAGSKGVNLTGKTNQRYFIPVYGEGDIVFNPTGLTYLRDGFVNNSTGKFRVLKAPTALVWTGDYNFGKVPDTPKDSIFIENSISFYLENTSATINANRDILVIAGKTLTLKVQNTNTMQIDSRIHGTSDDTDSNFTLATGNTFGGKKIILNPGTRTNSVGRLLVNGLDMEIASGVTEVTDKLSAIENGQGSFDVYNANLTLSGGILKVKQNTYSSLRGNFTVSGGVADFTGQSELLNAFRVPGTTTVCNAGTLICGRIRNGESIQSMNPRNTGVVKLEKGGTLITSCFTCYTNASSGNMMTCRGEVHFDGGILAMRSSNSKEYFFTYPATAIMDFTTEGHSWLVEKGGCVISNAWDLNLNAALESNAEDDGGLTKWGAGLMLAKAQSTFNGPIVVKQGTLQVDANDRFPNCKHLHLAPNGVYQCNGKNNTFERISGSGELRWQVMNITKSIAPGEDAETLGRLWFTRRLPNISQGTVLEIDVLPDGTSDRLEILNNNGDGKLDLSRLSLKVNDLAKLKNDKIYTIITVTATGDNKGISGEFASTNLPENWKVRYNYEAKTVQLVPNNGTVVMLI